MTIWKVFVNSQFRFLFSNSFQRALKILSVDPIKFNKITAFTFDEIKNLIYAEKMKNLPTKSELYRKFAFSVPKNARKR